MIDLINKNSFHVRKIIFVGWPKGLSYCTQNRTSFSGGHVRGWVRLFSMGWGVLAPQIFKTYFTQCASKKNHLRNMKNANFQNVFRDAWGCWLDLLQPKNFSLGDTGQPVRPILSAIFGYFSNFERQKNPIKCSVLTTFLHLGGQLGQLGSHESKIGLRTATQLE